MPEIQEYRAKIEAIQERLNKSNGEGDDEIRELKARLGTVRESLQRKQETIDSQKAEIATLREEGVQLSDMLGQALAALEAQNRGGIKEIVRRIDSEFAGLLADDEAQPKQEGKDGGGGRRKPATVEASPQEAESPETPSEKPKWDPEKESALSPGAGPALAKLLQRRNW